MNEITRVFIDLDGVLADYYGGICRAISLLRPWPYLCRLGDWNFFHGFPFNKTDAEIAPLMGHEFYEGLELLPDAKDLVRMAEETYGKQKVFFLSAPWDTPGCDSGKREWVKKHFPEYAKRTLIGSCKEACAFSGSMLLDDSEKNCQAFYAAGGYAQLVPRPWNARHADTDLSTGAFRNFKC